MNVLETNAILLCYDGSPGSKRAIATAGALFPGRQAIVLHVWTPATIVGAPYNVLVPAPTPVFNDSELRAAAMKLAEEGVDLASAAGLEAKPETAESSREGLAFAILEIATEYDAAVVVLGSRGLSTFEAVLLGSVSHAVAQHSHRPVLIVPAKPGVAAIAPAAKDATATA